MQRTRSLHLLQLAPDLGHPLANQAPIGLDLRFAGTAEKAEAASLPLEVGPAAHQPPRLIFEMGKLDLKLTLGGRRALAENLEDQSGPVDHLGANLVLEVLLLDRGQGSVDDQQPGALFPCNSGNLVDLALAEQSRGTDC